MSDLLEPDDATAAAQEWVDVYVDRRRIDDVTMDLLVQAEIARFQCDDTDADKATDRAYHRLIRQGYSVHDAVVVVSGARAKARAEAADLLVAEAQAELDGLGETAEPQMFCTDPWLHWRFERGSAQEHRPPSTAPPGCCKWCGRPFQRKDSP